MKTKDLICGFFMHGEIGQFIADPNILEEHRNHITINQDKNDLHKDYKSSFEELENACQEITRNTITISGENKFYTFTLCSDCVIETKNNLSVTYNLSNGAVRAIKNDLFVDLDHLLTICLLDKKPKYARRMYHLLRSWLNDNSCYLTKKISISALKECLGIEKNAQTDSQNFILKTIKPTIGYLQKYSDIYVDYKSVYIGRKVKEINLFFYKKSMPSCSDNFFDYQQIINYFSKLSLLFALQKNDENNKINYSGINRKRKKEEIIFLLEKIKNEANKTKFSGEDFQLNSVEILHYTASKMGRNLGQLILSLEGL